MSSPAGSDRHERDECQRPRGDSRRPAEPPGFGAKGAEFGAEFGAKFGAEFGAEVGAEVGAEFSTEFGAESFGAEIGAEIGAEFVVFKDRTSKLTSTSTLKKSEIFGECLTTDF